MVKNLFLLIIISVINSCTIGGNDSANNNNGVDHDKGKDPSATPPSVTVIKPSASEVNTMSANPLIQFTFNKPVNNINVDNIYIKDMDGNDISINNIQKYDDGNQIIYSIQPLFSYNTSYNIIFSSGISDNLGNRLNTTTLSLHTIKDDGGSDDHNTLKVNLLIPKPEDLNTDTTLNISFKTSEKILLPEADLPDVIKLHEGSEDGHVVSNIGPITYDSSNSSYKFTVQNLNNDMSYYLTIKDPEPKLKNQIIGNHVFYFTTMPVANYARLISPSKNLDVTGLIILYIDEKINITPSSLIITDEYKDTIVPTNFSQIDKNLYALKSVNKSLSYNHNYHILIKYPDTTEQKIPFTTSAFGISSRICEDKDIMNCKINGNSFIINFSELLSSWSSDDALNHAFSIYEGDPKNNKIIPYTAQFENDGSPVWGTTHNVRITIDSTILKTDTQYFIKIGPSPALYPNDPSIREYLVANNLSAVSLNQSLSVDNSK
jgi:hypothetical protein